MSRMVGYGEFIAFRGWSRFASSRSLRCEARSAPITLPTPCTPGPTNHPPLRCEARSAPIALPNPCTPGPTNHPPALPGPLCTHHPPQPLHTRPHKSPPCIARPALHPSPSPTPAHQAPQITPLHCQAHSAPTTLPNPCTPGPTNHPPALPGPLCTHHPVRENYDAGPPHPRDTNASRTLRSALAHPPFIWTSENLSTIQPMARSRSSRSMSLPHCTGSER
ncbi:hypothetical protein QF015_000961 [Paenarthrobacter sp. TE4293]